MMKPSYIVLFSLVTIVCLRSFYGARVIPPVPVSHLPPLPPRPKRHWRFLARCQSPVQRRRLSSPSLTFFLLLLLVMAGDVELNPGPGSSRSSSLSPGQELELSDEGFVIISPAPVPVVNLISPPPVPVVNLISPPPVPVVNLISPIISNLPGPSTRPYYAYSAPPGLAEPLFNFHLDEVPVERFSLILAKHDKPDVTRIYQQHHDVEILSRALDGAHLTPVTGDIVASFTNPPYPSFSAYAERILDAIAFLENKTVWGFPYVDSKQLEDAIINGFKVCMITVIIQYLRSNQQ